MIVATLSSITLQQGLLWGLLGIVALLGLVALLSPARFTAMATRGGQWVDTNKIAAVFDKRVDIDRYVLPFSRLLGAAVLASVAVLAYVLVRYV